jgi:hypothetical protein
LWYLAEISSVFDLDLEKIAEQNIEKLAKRKDNNKIQGEGNNR